MPEKFKLSPHDGTFFKTKEAVGVYFERIFDHPVETVWKALTDPAQLSLWLAPTTIDGRQGGTITLQLTGGTMGGKIIRWKENVLLEYSWHNGSSVRWELLQEGEGRTRLVFTHSHVNHWQLVDAAKGWHYHLDMLSLILDGKKGPAHPVEMWDDITREATVRYNESIKGFDRQAPPPFVIERVFNAPVERVWKALTAKNEIQGWFMSIDRFEPKEDFEFTFTAHHNNKEYIHYCRVTEVLDKRKLTYSFRFLNVNGITYVTWELFPEGGRTRVRLTHYGLEKIAPAGPDYARHNFEEGWTYFLEKSLPAWMAGKPVALVK
jgi:uncharacterized protein YndB with AHSA1/START domain